VGAVKNAPTYFFAKQQNLISGITGRNCWWNWLNQMPTNKNVDELLTIYYDIDML